MKLPEALVMLAQIAVQDGELGSWILGFRGLTLENRCVEFQRLAQRMAQAKEDADVTEAVALLAQPEIFAAFCRTLEENAR